MYKTSLAFFLMNKNIFSILQVWSRVTGLAFDHVTCGPTHIKISFGDSIPGTNIVFDGPDGTLALASSPIDGGDAHFDEAEKWTVNSFRGCFHTEVV